MSVRDIYSATLDDVPTPTQSHMVIVLPRIQYWSASATSVQEIRVCNIKWCFVPALLCKLALCLDLVSMDFLRCFALLEYSFQSSVCMSFALVWFYFTQMFMYVNYHSYLKKKILGGVGVYWFMFDYLNKINLQTQSLCLIQYFTCISLSI